ncbi:putative sarcosine oxidase [Acorus calamus]|uniref:Sarcosine oxidase n=1 Tax=Acorus calamus TaxID=4465 RepID=A0AAV9CLE8_ACOCL|nr:putative sarcosine oxidase [Acorus calamus]
MESQPSDDRIFDAIVVGAGIIGCCTAYEIAKRGRSVLLVERFDFLHHLGSSHGESRTIRSTYPEPYYLPLVLDSARLWAQAHSDIGFSTLTKAHQLDLGPSNNKSLLSVISNCESSSLPHRLLKPDELSKRFSGLFSIPDDWIGLVTELGGVIKPTKAQSMFLALSVKYGAVLKDHVKVSQIKRLGGILRVETDGGDYFLGKKCVVTVGAWTRELVKTVTGLGLPIQPIHTTICYWRIREGFEGEFTAEAGFPTFASYGEPYIYGTPSLEFPGLIKVALHGGHACDPDRRAWTHDMETIKKAVGPWIEGRFGGRVESEEPVSAQACMYSMTPDGDYVIDFLGGGFGRDVVVGAGFSGHGFKMGPVVGRILADLALDGEAHGVDLEPFRLGRFEKNPLGNVKDFEEQVSLHDFKN